MSEFADFIRVSLVELMALFAGVGIVAWLLPQERRLPIVLGGGVAVGHALSIFVLMALLRLLPIGIAVPVVFLLALPPAAFAILSLRRRPYVWGISFGWTVLALSLLTLISVGAVVDLAASVWNGSTHENLVVRMAMAAHAAESPWPVMDPYSPDHQRLYRHAAQVWTAAIMRISGAGLYSASVVTVLASVLAIAGGLFAAVARLRSYLAGFLGASLFLTATPANFLGVWKTPFGSLSTSKAYGLATVKRELAQGYVLGHGLALAPGNDFTLMVGLGAGSGAVFLASTLVDPTTRRRTGILVAAMALAAAAAAAEQILPVAVATLFAVAAGLAVWRLWSEALSFAVLGLIASVLVVVPEGTYAALAFGSEIGQRAGFAFTPEYFLRLPTEYLFFAGSESNFFAVPPETFRIWLFESIAIKEIGWIYVALASLVILSRRRYSASILAFAVAPAVALLIPGLVSDRLYEINIARFTVLGISLGGLAAGVAAAELLGKRKAGLARVGAGVLAGGLIVFAGATWMLAVPLWPAKFSEQPYPHLNEDLEATDYLRSLDYGRRALILPGPTNKEEVNSDGWEGMHRFVISFGATAIPMGLDRWGAAHLYQPYYLPAYNSLDEAAMVQLRIDTIYVAPHLLTDDQERMLENAVVEGRAKLLFESSAGNRQIYEYQSR